MKIFNDCIIPESALIEKDVIFGKRVILAGDNIIIHAKARLENDCVIAEGVTIGQGALVRTGSVVLSSVPPNSIVEGNPAQVVGYVDRIIRGSPELRLIDIREFLNLSRPARIPLDVGGSAIYLMKRVIDTSGSLTVGEVPSVVPFSPARFFAVFDVPSFQLRGEHAHKHCQQFLICLHGSCRVLLDDGERRCEVTLDSPDIGVYMPEMIWGTQYRYSPNAVLLVFASRPYEVDDYLRTYDEFLKERTIRAQHN